MKEENVESHIKEKFEIIEMKGKGAYGVVWKVRDKKSKKIYALKKIFEAFQHKTDAQRTYREVIYLKGLNKYDNIIKLYSIYKANNGRDLYLLFEYMDTDLHIVIRAKILEETHKKFVIFQLFKAIKYMHSINIIHRDWKPSNILINSDCLIKVADFGLARSINQDNNKDNVITENIATRWYRAPEILFQSKLYGLEADLWSLGCILAELLLGKVLFNGQSSVNQLEMIIELLGKPSSEDVKEMKIPLFKTVISECKIKKFKNFNNLFINCNKDGVDLIKKLLTYNPKKRISLDQCLRHPFLKKFYNPNETIRCNKEIKIELKDTEKLTVKEYRNEIYRIIEKSNNDNINILNLKNIKENKKDDKTNSKQSNISNKKTITTKEKPKKSEKIKVNEKRNRILENKRTLKPKLMNTSTKKDKKSSSITSKKLSTNNRIKQNPTKLIKIKNNYKNSSIEKSKNNWSSKDKLKNEIYNKKSINSLLIKKKSSNSLLKKHILLKDSNIKPKNNFFKTRIKKNI